MGRNTRNRMLLSAINQVTDTDQQNVLRSALDNTAKFNILQGLGSAAKRTSAADDLVKLAIDQRSYLPDVRDRGLTTYGREALDLQTDNAKGLAGDLRGNRGVEGQQNAFEYLDGFAPETTEEKVNRKARANKLASAELDAVYRDANPDSEAEAIHIANVNRLENAEYGDVLLENSDYVRERLNQGDNALAEGFGVIREGLGNGELQASELNSKARGIIRGGLKYVDNPQEPARMAGQRVNDLVGAGTFADVYRDPEMSGVVRKEQPRVVDVEVGGANQLFGNRAGLEAELQMAGADLGVGPRVDYIERNPDGSTAIGMQNVGDNYRTLRSAEKELSPKQMANVLIQHNLQLGKLGSTPITLQGGQKFDGIAMADRHTDNVMIHNMNNRPIQLDFGPMTSSPGGGFQGSGLFERGPEQARYISEKASKAMIAAGLSDEGKMLNDTVLSQIAKGDLDGAMDVAQQGMALAEKIKGPVKSTNVLSPAAFVERDGSLSAATSENLLGTEQLYSRFS